MRMNDTQYLGSEAVHERKHFQKIKLMEEQTAFAGSQQNSARHWICLMINKNLISISEVKGACRQLCIVVCFDGAQVTGK